MTNILASLDPNEPDAGVRGAEALGAALERMSSPRSIAELRLEQNDVEWLRSWARGLSATAARRSGDLRIARPLEATRQQAFGLVFLALAAETARREAAEGHVWGPVRRRLSAAAESVLFTQGQPKQELKDALESACRRWQLRHVFGQEGLQAWYASVYLQFGFTERTIESRLPARLANAEALPTAVHHLLRDQRLKSDSFASLWSTMLGLRRRNVTEMRARQVLALSPWVLPEWTDALLEAAVARMELTPSGLPDAEAAPSLFTVPHLEWEGRQPRFVVELVNLADIAGELPQGAYRIRAGGASVEFTIDDVGTPLGVQPLRLRLTPDRVTGVVERHEGEDAWTPVAGEEVTLWEQSDEVGVFREDGTRLDAWSTPLQPEHPYLLVLAPGLTIEPTPERWARTDDGCLVVLLAAGWPDGTSVHLDGEKIWDPLIAAPGRPDPLKGFSMSPRGTDLGDAPRLRLLGLSGEVTSVRADRLAVDFAQDGATVEAFLPEGAHDGRESVLVRTRDASGAVRTGRIPLAWFGAQQLRGDGWERLPVGEIDECDLGQRLRAFTPPEWGEPTLLVGNRPIGRIGRAGRARGSLDAWGARLLVAHGQFNRDPSGELTLADAVMSRGVIHDMDANEDFGGAALVTLRQPVDLTETRVVGIGRDGAVGDIEPNPAGERSWVIEALPDNALAVMHGTEWIGAWWRRPPAPPASAADAVRRMGLLRDARAPLLSDRYAEWVRRSLSSHPVSGLSWLIGLPNAASPAAPPIADEFAHVMRELLDEWQPDDTCAAEIVRALQAVGEEAVSRLAETAFLAPAPTARLLTFAFEDTRLRRRVREALLEALGWSGGSSADMLAEIGWQFGVDGGFLEHLGRVAKDRLRGRAATPLQRQNLLVAMNLSGDFRRWLAGHLIAED